MEFMPIIANNTCIINMLFHIHHFHKSAESFFNALKLEIVIQCREKGIILNIFVLPPTGGKRNNSLFHSITDEFILRYSCAVL